MVYILKVLLQVVWLCNLLVSFSIDVLVYGVVLAWPAFTICHKEDV